MCGHINKGVRDVGQCVVISIRESEMWGAVWSHQYGSQRCGAVCSHINEGVRDVGLCVVTSMRESEMRRGMCGHNNRGVRDVGRGVVTSIRGSPLLVMFSAGDDI